MEIKTPLKSHAYAYHICKARYNCSYAMATKPIKFLELHYTMTQFLILLIILVIVLTTSAPAFDMTFYMQ